MMSAQMVNVSGSAGTVADLAPGAKDGMRMLEAKAAEVAQMEARSQAQGKFFIIFLTALLVFSSDIYLRKAFFSRNESSLVVVYRGQHSIRSR